MFSCSVIPSTQLNWFSAGWLLLFLKLKTATKRMIFEAVSYIQQTVTRELRTIRADSIRFKDDVNVVPKRPGTILNDGINKYLCFVWSLQPQFRNLIVTLCKHSFNIRQLICSPDHWIQVHKWWRQKHQNAYLPWGCETLMGLGPCLTAHVVRDPSVWLHMNCFPSWCHEMDFRGSAHWHRISAVLVLRSHKTIWPVSYPISN
jgi:hypothetical protein